MPAQVVLALDFGGSKTAATIADAAGARIATTVLPVVPDNAGATFEQGVDAARALVRDAGTGTQLAAVGVCTFGIPHDDRVDLAPSIPGWGDLAFGDRLRAAFPGVPVETATDVKAAARAEADTGALVGCDPGLYVNLGTGLAVAVVAGGHVLHGGHGAAGEIGYNLRRPADVDDPLPTMLEDAVSGRALSAQARAAGIGADAGDVFDRAGHDAAAARLVDRFVAELAMHLVNVTALVDPVRIVVGGGITRSWDRFEQRLRRALATHVPFPPELELGRYPFDAPLRGALALAHAACRHTALERTNR